MSNQPLDDKKLKTGETYLLNRIMANDPIVLGMELQGRYGTFNLSGLKSGKLLVSTGDKFIVSTDNVKDAVKEIAISEKTPIEFYHKKKIETTYVAEEEITETKLYEELVPKKLTVNNGLKVHGKRFYIVKKKPNGSSSGKLFCAYNIDTRNLIFVHWNKDLVIWLLINKYKLIEHKDI